MGASVTISSQHATAKVGHGCVLDGRRALYHEEGQWLAVADIHYGFELNRSRTRGHNHVMPQWCMAATETRLISLLRDYQPETLVLAGDVMDGGGSWRETVKLIDRLKALVPHLLFIEGNHERKQVKATCGCLTWQRIGRFIFHHGHRFDSVLSEVRFELEHPSEFIHITGHEHPATVTKDESGESQHLPALIQQRLRGTVPAEHWIMPAFSPWAGGSEYISKHERLATWQCLEKEVKPLEPRLAGQHLHIV